MKMQIVKNNEFVALRVIPSILVVLVVGFLLRIILSPYGTLTLDQNTFIAWSNRLIDVGFSQFYKIWSDYLPGYPYVLWFLGLINKLDIISPLLLYKLPAILGDIGTGYLIYQIVKKLKDQRWGIISTCLYIFNPAVIANSTFWGQVDGLTSFFSLLTVWSFGVNTYISAISLAVGTLIKPQMAVVSLVILFLMIQKKWNIQKMVVYITTAFLVFVGGFVPFSGGENLISFVFSRINLSLNQYPYTSINAFNFWGILGMWKPDNWVLELAGLVLILTLFLVFGVKFLKQKGGEYIALSFLYAISFMFMTRVHERHLLPVLAPLSVAVSLEPILILTLVGFSFIYVSNLYWSWNWVTNNFQQVFGDVFVKTLSLFNVGLLSIFVLPKKILTNFKYPSIKKLFGRGSKPYVFSKPGLSKKKLRILFILVIVFASITRFFNLGEPRIHYFDEVYHAFTAQAMLHGNTKAWEWWNPNPTGFAYEWTHPPLAKEGMVLGMRIFGESSLGWRLPGAILGVGSVILIYFIAKEIFEDELLAVLSSAILSLDGLALVMSRIGMNDSYVLFFSLACLLAFLKKRNFWSAVFFGLALASKWSALWMIPILIGVHFVLKRKLFNLSYIFFLILPPLIYLLTYFPLFTNTTIQQEYVTNNNYGKKVDKLSLANLGGKTGIIPLDMFIDTQKQMWWYHTRLKATHPYTSMWYTWPFLVRPIYLYTSDETNNSVGRIYAFGNPIVFWVGVGAVGTCFYLAFKERNKKLGLIVFAYLVFFAPWAMSPRIMFLYHYLPSIPFMAVLIAYILRRYRQFMAGFLIVTCMAFIYFYPHWIGLRIPSILDSSYYWFRSWR